MLWLFKFYLEIVTQRKVLYTVKNKIYVVTFAESKIRNLKCSRSIKL